MSALNNSLLLGQEGGGGYAISRSLRFNSSDSAYLSRTPASAGNRKTWTWAGWVKRSALGVNAALFGRQQSDDTNTLDIRFGTGDTLRLANWNAYILETAQVFRDTSAWFHLVVVLDTTQATANNRARMYVNGAEITQFGTRSNPAQNADLAINNTTLHHLGATVSGGGGATYHFPGYLADIHFIDGQALDPTSFGEFSATTGVWMPKAYTGTYGTNGFHLDFSNNASAAALGTDSAGSNDWTANNISVTAGAGNDSLVDVPTNGSEVDTGSGGQVRGNYCTLNPLANPGSSTLSNGNLDVVTASASYGKVNGTIAVSSGKWYWEVVCTVRNQDAFIGIEGVANANTDTYTGGSATGTGWYNGGTIYSNASSSSYGTTYAANDVIGVALDMDAGTLVFYKNGVSAGTAKTGLSGSYTASVSDGATSGSGNTYVFNFGQRPFAYTAPSGFKALNTSSLPAPLVTKPSTVMDVVTYTGTGSALTPTSTLGFNPDLVWIKGRSGATDHAWYDIVRGVEARLESNNTGAEVTSDGGVTAFNTAGFSVGTLAQVNTNTATYAAWCWDAGSSTVTNTDGTITSQVRANASAGFSVVTFTPSGASSVGHGLGVAPALIVVKNRSIGDSWYTYHVTIGTGKYMVLNSTAAALTSANGFTSVSSSTFTVGTDVISNYAHVAYCFAPVSGYSAFGSYTGNGSTDGAFVYTGFRPRWILVKRTDAGTNSWAMLDTARSTYNVGGSVLFSNLADAELASDFADALSNGFKLRAASNNWNGSTFTYIYAAFAESPFQYARAR